MSTNKHGRPKPKPKPASPSTDAGGVKDDDAKLRFDLIQDRAIAEYVAVLTHGAEKYAPNGWRKVPNAGGRYYAALQRHLSDWRLGETFDSQSGMHHLGHALCCLAFLLELELDANPVSIASFRDRFKKSIEIARKLKAEREARKERPPPLTSERDSIDM